MSQVPATTDTSPGSPDAPASRWSSGWHRATGLVLAAYLVFALLELSVLRRDPSAFNRMVEWSGAPVVRCLAGAVMVALVFHGLSGLRIVVLESTRPSQRVAEATRLAVVLATAISIPLVGVFVLRPYAEGWWP